ncbi:hypothetical protein CVT24_010600 [Panaeolus cyanescens]|uniref:Uncharacterized protein n=1 Tax=Panaeolus cyanescens TaxID=181874 RepID=A0A409YM22_9AGAR|nr:hypothetical protein CVT24_010600 [Panaeolus cyanescens]
MVGWDGQAERDDVGGVDAHGGDAMDLDEWQAHPTDEGDRQAEGTDTDRVEAGPSAAEICGQVLKQRWGLGCQVDERSDGSGSDEETEDGFGQWAEWPEWSDTEFDDFSERDDAGINGEPEVPNSDPNAKAPTEAQLADAYFRLQYARAAAKSMELGEFDAAATRRYIFKVEGHLSERKFNQLPQVYPDTPHESLKRTKKHIESLSGFQSVRYDCCVDSCVCFTGTFKDLDKCPVCNKDQFQSNGQPRKYFEYIPIIPRLKAQIANPQMYEKMLHRSKHEPEENVIRDIRSNNAPDPPSDNEAPRKKRDHTLYVPLSRTCVFKEMERASDETDEGESEREESESEGAEEGEDSGGSEGEDEDEDEDEVEEEADEERMDGGVEEEEDDEEEGWEEEEEEEEGQDEEDDDDDGGDDNSNIAEYDPANLPMRTHKQFMRQAARVQLATTSTAAKELSKEYGIKGVPLLSYLSTMAFPASFPFDFMHLIWENGLKNLLLFWNGKFKKLDHTNRRYVISPENWKKIGAETAACARTIPSSFGAAVPNFTKEGMIMTAEMHTNWAMFIAPIVLYALVIDNFE